MLRRNARLLAGLAVLALAGVLVAVLLFTDLITDRAGTRRPAPPTSQPALTTTSQPALTTTSTTIPGVVSTGRGPSAFTTTTAPGPIQVIVEGAACVRFVGDGWRVRYRIHNRGPAATGPVVGQVDDGDPTVFDEALRVERCATHQATSVVLGGGDAIIVTWVATPTGGRAASRSRHRNVRPTRPTCERPSRSPPPSASPDRRTTAAAGRVAARRVLRPIRVGVVGICLLITMAR
jgi:hypothetical protein